MNALLAFTFLALAQSAEEPPAPGPTTQLQVEIRPSKAWELRQHISRHPRCIPVPRQMLKSAAELLGEKLPADAKLTGAGDTLGVLEPLKEGRFRLRLFRRGRMIDERFLPAPEDGFLTTPRPVLGERGNLVALVQREGFAVYVGATLAGIFRDHETHAPDVAFVRGEIHWCPSPSRVPLSDVRSLKEEAMPALWIRAEVDGGGREVLLRVDPRRLDPQDPLPGEWSLELAPRRDGKLWLVGAVSAEALEVTATGGVVRRLQLPYRFPVPGDDPKQVEAMREEALRKAEELMLQHPFFADATRSKAGSGRLRIYPWQRRIFARVLAYDRDLLLVTHSDTKPANSLLWFPYGQEEGARCFELGELVDGASLGLTTLVEDQLWFSGPFAYLSLEDLRQLWETQQRPESRGSGAAPR